MSPKPSKSCTVCATRDKLVLRMLILRQWRTTLAAHMATLAERGDLEGFLDTAYNRHILIMELARIADRLKRHHARHRC